MMPRPLRILGLVALLVLLLVAVGLLLRVGLPPAPPALTAAGVRREVRWEAVPVSELGRPPWVRWKLDSFRAGRSEQRVDRWEDGKRSWEIVEAPASPTKYFRQELLRLEVPGGLWKRTRISGLVIAHGDVSADGQEYAVDLSDVSAVSSGHWLAFATDFDKMQRVLTLRVAWAYPGQEGQACTLRYRLTPEGFVFLGEE